MNNSLTIAFWAATTRMDRQAATACIEDCAEAKRRPRGKTVFRKILSHARQLGVSRWHLRCVLTGERHSPRVLERYLQLKAKEQQ
jgi:hypothetical protein